MNTDFEFDKYIWQIQFHPWFIMPHEFTYNTTIDYLNRLVIVRTTVVNTNMVNERIYEIYDEDFEQLLQHSQISEIREFEAKTEYELDKLDSGYRDGWRLEYSYFTQDVPPRTDGSLGHVFRGNPLENILIWIRNTYPDADIRI